jgi:hypothetical protein
LPDRRVLRIVTAVLLMWIAVDLAAVHPCTLDGGYGQAPARPSVSAPPCSDGPGPSHAVLHQDDCFCHGISTGAGRALPVAPRRQAEAVRESPTGHPLQASAALYHPPQLPA